jgi:hypothetical protein
MKMAFLRYKDFFREPFSDTPMWPKVDKSALSQSAITDKTIVISKAEMDKSYKEFEKRAKEIRKDMQG